MTDIARQGFMFMKVVASNCSQLRPVVTWNRRWLLLHRNGTLMCYDSFSANQLKFKFDLQSLGVSREDVAYPDGGTDKPWIISVVLKTQDERLLLEADCEECMDRWAELILESLPHKSTTPAIRSNGFRQFPSDPQIPKPLSPKPILASQVQYNDGTRRSDTSRYLDISDTPILSNTEEVKMRNVINEQVYEDVVYQSKREVRMSTYRCNNGLPSHGVPIKKSPPPVKPKTKTLAQIKTHETHLDNNTFKGKLELELAPKREDPSKELTYYVLETRDSLFLESNCGKRPAPSPPVSDKPNFLTALPNVSTMLKEYWPIYVMLPNQMVYKQLVNFSIPVQDCLQLLLNCFEHSYTSPTPTPSSFLVAQVVGDIYQTYHPQKCSQFDGRKRKQFLDWKKSFYGQEVLTSKIIKLSLRADVDAKLNFDRLTSFLYQVNNLSDTDQFSMSVICFVKGIITIKDMSVSKRMTSSLSLIFKRLSRNKNLDVPKFIPPNPLKPSSHFRSIQDDIEIMKSCNTLSLYNSFMDNLNACSMGDAISLPIVLVKKAQNQLKHINSIFIVSTNHVGVCEIGNGSDFTKSEAICEFWHFSELLGWFVQPADDVVFIQLHKLLESSGNLVFLSPNADFIDGLFTQFLGMH